jgi:hypothetical protein
MESATVASESAARRTVVGAGGKVTACGMRDAAKVAATGEMAAASEMSATAARKVASATAPMTSTTAPVTAAAVRLGQRRRRAKE